METLRRTRHIVFIALAALTIVLAVNAPSEARGGGGGGGGHSSDGGHSGGAVGHGFDGQHGFDGNHGFAEHHFDGNHFGHDRFAVGPVFPYYGYDYSPDYAYQAPAYWYYCPSYGAYYPNVATCPDAWVPVPAS